MKSQKACVFAKLFEIIAGVIFVLMLILVVTQVLVRYLLPFSIPWTEELARYSLMMMTFLGATVALRRGDHICVTTFVERMSPYVQKWLYLSFVPVILFFNAIIFSGSLRMARQMWQSPVGATGWVKMGHLYVISSCGSLLMMVAILLWSIEYACRSYSVPKCTDRSVESQ